MTVAALPAVAEYDEDGASTRFPVPYRFKAAADLLVERIVDETPIRLSLGIDYTVTGGATDAGGTVQRSVPSAGGTLRISRRTVRAQPMVYTTGDRFPAKSHEEALDRQMLIAQEQDAAQADIYKRAILVPHGSTGPRFDKRSIGFLFIAGGSVSAVPVLHVIAQTSTLFDDGAWGGDFISDGAWG